MCKENELAQRFERFATAVSKAYKSIQKLKNAEMERLGLKGSHVMCLYYLGKSEDGLTGGDLCRLCNEDKAAISRTILDLTQRGYVISSLNDLKRKYRAKLTLTEQGMEQNRQIRQAIAAAVERASEGVGEVERACFYKVFFTITENLEKRC